MLATIIGISCVSNVNLQLSSISDQHSSDFPIFLLVVIFGFIVFHKSLYIFYWKKVIAVLVQIFKGWILQ